MKTHTMNQHPFIADDEQDTSFCSQLSRCWRTYRGRAEVGVRPPSFPPRAPSSQARTSPHKAKVRQLFTEAPLSHPMTNISRHTTHITHIVHVCATGPPQHSQIFISTCTKFAC